jgi:signal transduction histidine kinase
LTRLLDLAMENAAAQRGLLLLAPDGVWHVESEKALTTSAAMTTIAHHSPLELYDSDRLATSLVHYVSRTRASLVIDHAAADPLLSKDRYVRRAQVRSLLLIPILHQADLVGLLYFENNSLAGAFHPRRVEILEVIAAQAAISIVNARLYQEMESRVEARTQELSRQKTALEQAMTQLQSAQQQLVLTEKMASVGTLTAGVAHEINNPANFAHVGAQNMLNALERFHKMLLELLDDSPEAEPVSEFISAQVAELRTQGLAVVEGTTRIRDLVRDLRAFSRVDEAEYKLAAIGDNLVSTVNLVRMQYSSIAQISCDIRANPVLECRPAQLNQVFMNLIINACQAIESRRDSGPAPFGSVQIRTDIEDGQLQIRFADNGCGMPAAVQQRIFEPFFTTKSVGDGTGLGLAISFQIVAGHNGHIDMVSTPGSGTTFTIRLPLPDPAQQM